MSIGRSVHRRDDPRLLCGGGRYLADVALPGALHACFVRSDHAHATIAAIDGTDALDVAGVVAVLQAADLPPVILFNARHAGLIATEQPVLAVDRVRFAGEAVAVVIATDRYAAEDGAEKVVVDYEQRDVAVRADQEPGSGALLFDDVTDNVVFHEARVFGDPDGAFAAASQITTRQLSFGRVSATPMETRGCIARFDRHVGTLDVWASTQSPHSMRRKLARITGLGEHRIIVHFHDVGGAFGQKIPLHPEEAVVALAAQHMGCTIKWVEDRRENLMAAPHAREQHIGVDLALDDAGTFLAMRARIMGDAGAYSFNAGTALTEPYLTGRSMIGPYRIGSYAYDVTARLTNKSPVAPYRGVGFVNAQVIRELVIDDAARQGRWDPLELRRRNLVRRADFPYTTATGMVYDSGSYTECLAAVIDAIDVASLRTARHANAPDERRLGVGISPFVEPTAPGSKLVEQVWGTSSAEGDVVRVTLEPSGTATISFGTGSQGQGGETTVAQVVADVLDIPFEDVAVSLDTTSTAPVSLSGTRGSRTAVITGGAAALAAQKLRDTLALVAAAMLEAAVEDVVIDRGRLYVRGSESIALTTEQVILAGLTSPTIRSVVGNVTFSASHSFDPPGATYSNGCVGVVVEVDPATGGVTPVRCVVAHDCGTVINPAIVEGQIVGAMVQGFGQALLERIGYADDGQPTATTLMDYLLPTASDTPPVEVIHLTSPSPHTWKGVKGAGEAGTIGMTAAVVCAVADACGPRAADIAAIPLLPAEVASLFDEI